MKKKKPLVVSQCSKLFTMPYSLSSLTWVLVYTTLSARSIYYSSHLSFQHWLIPVQFSVKTNHFLLETFSNATRYVRCPASVLPHTSDIIIFFSLDCNCLFNHLFLCKMYTLHKEDTLYLKHLVQCLSHVKIPNID